MTEAALSKGRELTNQIAKLKTMKQELAPRLHKNVKLFVKMSGCDQEEIPNGNDMLAAICIVIDQRVEELQSEFDALDSNSKKESKTSSFWEDYLSHKFKFRRRSSEGGGK